MTEHDACNCDVCSSEKYGMPLCLSGLGEDSTEGDRKRAYRNLARRLDEVERDDSDVDFAPDGDVTW